MKIKAENYPVILITAFVIGIILAMALGFRPGYGSHERQSHDESRLMTGQMAKF